jgi:putative acetyltransferase
MIIDNVEIMNGPIIRDETVCDYDAVRKLLLLAFGEDSPGNLANDLRRSGDAALSMVAEHEGKIAGHILFSRIEAPLRALTLAPLGVRPDLQKRGIGSALIRHGLERAGKEGWDAVFVLGSPAYYRRFGFDPALARNYDNPYNGPAFMALLLHDAAPRTGRLVFPSAFDEDIREHAVRRGKGLM